MGDSEIYFQRFVTKTIAPVINYISDKMVTRYGSVNQGEVEEETIFEKLITPSRKKMIIGIFLSTSSGILFTANNFIVNQFEVVVSDALFVRCVIQATIFSCIIFTCPVITIIFSAIILG